MATERPIEWVENRIKMPASAEYTAAQILPTSSSQQIRAFHRQIPGYRISPFKGLSNLAV
jgi:hypothetical protein